jgi:choline-sulfatase
VRDELVSSVDLFPTFLDYAGLPRPANRPGHSLRPLLEGRGSWPREEVIGGRNAWDSPARRVHGIPPKPGAFFLRNRDWRYFFFVGSRREDLYDMRTDPREEHNVAKKNPELARQFRNRILAWQTAMREPFE